LANGGKANDNAGEKFPRLYNCALTARSSTSALQPRNMALALVSPVGSWAAASLADTMTQHILPLAQARCAGEVNQLGKDASDSVHITFPLIDVISKLAPLSQHANQVQEPHACQNKTPAPH
jgi:hypothetical protein